MGNRRIVIALSLLALLGCSHAFETKPQILRGDLPVFPADPVADYAPEPAMAHAAFPLFDPDTGGFSGPARIWLKGSPTFDRYVATAEGGRMEGELAPPYYVTTVEVPPGRVDVEFHGSGGTRMRTAHAVSGADLGEGPRPFSVVFFGCFQPFGVRGGDAYVLPHPVPEKERPDFLERIRLLFERVCRNGFDGFPPALFLAGTGDQIYVEGAYHDFEQEPDRHPLSAWTVEFRPRPRVPLAAFPAYLDQVYRHFWSFRTLQSALAARPAALTWDDHEIRDGWGSQGDEHVYRDSWYRVAREAFLAHQFSRGPSGAGEVAAGQPLHQGFRVRGIPFFLLDLRSHRDVSVPQVMGKRQWDVLEAFVAGLDPAVEPNFILVSPSPVFFPLSARADLAKEFTAEIRDDLLDAWDSEPNKPEWHRLIDLIVRASDRGLRPILVSGDYHLASMTRVTREGPDGRKTVLCYEILASGLANADSSTWKQDLMREGLLEDDAIQRGNLRLHPESGFTDGNPNFAGLEFVADGVNGWVFLSSDEGWTRYRVPLTFGSAEDSFGERITRGMREVKSLDSSPDR